MKSKVSLKQIKREPKLKFVKAAGMYCVTSWDEAGGQKEKWFSLKTEGEEFITSLSRDSKGLEKEKEEGEENIT